MKQILANTLVCALLAGSSVIADDGTIPRYKPSARSPEPIDIRTDLYGASNKAPDALGIGDRVPDFVVPRAGGGSVSLGQARANGPVVIIFYRGHW